MIDHDDLLERLHYDPDTGKFVWSEANRGCLKGKRAGSVDGCGYVSIGFNSRLHKAHRLAWLYVHGVWPEGDLDHINGNKTDNRIANLREASRSDNNSNKPKQKNNKSGYKGVSWDKVAQKWRAQIKVKFVVINLGRYESKIDAAEAYNRAAKRYQGDFARLNNIKGMREDVRQNETKAQSTRD